MIGNALKNVVGVNVRPMSSQSTQKKEPLTSVKEVAFDVEREQTN